MIDNYKSIIKPYIERFNSFLSDELSQLPIDSTHLKDAICYSTLNGGKRIRALLVYFSGIMFDSDIENLDYVACAVELIHTYSLIHDDLPSMDDDSMRRGKPTCHIQFDEATAILTGDILQSLAFEYLTHQKLKLSPEQITLAIRTLSHASSHMVSGQMIDLKSENQQINLENLNQLHTLKTGKLITASLLLGLISSKYYQSEIYVKRLSNLGDLLGLAFQIQDDVLDLTSSTEVLGKAQGSDISLGKSTYPSILGMTTSQTLLDQTFHKIYHHIGQLPATKELTLLIQWIEQRKF
ncbi:polyprenyl synthetase family protein [Thiotrichales bacterium 19S9-12]|nr:polyprenyl synthetase family protein [Thiotrichales bacterium 19S9-11]MCF6811352.1 polyprenyl synthetase family protein [Thiotrichales bacterium 19S9-12]